MDKQLIDEIKKKIKESHLTDEAKTQLISLMDFINYPEVKERILRIIDLEKKVTDLEIKYLKEMNRRFRESDIFGYQEKSPVIVANTRKQMEENLLQNIQNTQPIQGSMPTHPQNQVQNDQQAPTMGGQPNMETI